MKFEISRPAHVLTYQKGRPAYNRAVDLINALNAHASPYILTGVYVALIICKANDIDGEGPLGVDLIEGAGI